jgi:hypothetical protein
MSSAHRDESGNRVIRNLVALSLFCSTALWNREAAPNAEIGKWGRFLFSPILSIGARGGPGTQIGIRREFLFDRFGITPPEPLVYAIQGNAFYCLKCHLHCNAVILFLFLIPIGVVHEVRGMAVHL